MPELYAGATEYVANSFTFLRGTIADITNVYVYHTLNPNESPTEEDFTEVHLVSDPFTDPLGSQGLFDIVSLIGPGPNADVTLTAGDYQRFVAIRTTDEFVIRKTDTLTIL